MKRTPPLQLAVLILVALAGCNSQTEDRTSPTATTSPPTATTSPTTGEPAGDPYEAPVIAAVSVALGADLTDIYKAVLAARRPFVADCISESGWTVSSTELDELFDSGDSDGGTMSSYIDQVILDFEAPEPANEPQDRRRADQVVACMDSAESEFPNPNTSVLAAIEDFDRDVSARVASDSRVADATVIRDECAAQQGVPATNGVEPIATLSNSISEIQMAVGGGSKTTAAGISELTNLQTTVRAVEACYEIYRADVEVVVGEVQMAELEARPELIPSIVDQTSALMNQYRDLLPDPAG